MLLEKETNIKVSVIVACYKHAKYIRQCLDSILMQKVNFKYEIVVSDDCSNDGTKEILFEYKEKYPDIFVININKINLGAAENGYRANLCCKGLYRATCEGDDYWVDEMKLQKQVDILDSHPEYSAVATNTVNVDNDGSNPKVLLMPWQVNKVYSMKHYLKYGMLLHGNSFMRRVLSFERDKEYEELWKAEPTMTDVIRRISLYSTGGIYVLSDITHAHRNGLADATSFLKQNTINRFFYGRMYFRIVDNTEEYFKNKYNLGSLKANRMSADIIYVFKSHINADMNELRENWSLLSTSLKCLTIWRIFTRVVRIIIHKIARMIVKI